MKTNAAIQSALDYPSGARFYRMALQVNSFEYLKRHNRPTVFGSEGEYNRAIVEACRTLRVEVLATGDHYEVSTSESLRKAASDAGIFVFPGFEAKTKEGVHILCLCDPSKDATALERIIGECGVHSSGQSGSPIGTLDVESFLQTSRKWGSICIAAHVTSETGGLLCMLGGEARARAWRARELLACSIPGPIADAPQGLRQILLNKEPSYVREHPVAVVNAQDVSAPEDLQKPGSTCFIKMSDVSIEGLRQAFLDPESRIRLHSDPGPEEHAEFVALAWEGGFLDGARIHFNDNLNVLIGGRGTGKSTVIESIRYVLGIAPLGEEARRAHEGIVKSVLQGGTKISLLVRSHRPTKRDYLIERIVSNPPVVRDETGTVLPLAPSDIIARTEVFGQHEISELSKSPEKRTRLLDRFVDRDTGLIRRKAQLKQELDKSRSRLVETQKEQTQVQERLAALPTLEETLKRFQQAGLEERLKEQSLLVREERVLATAQERTVPFRDIAEQLRRSLPIDRAFLSPKALDGLPGKKTLLEADGVLQRLTADMEQVVSALATALERAGVELKAVHDRWDVRKASVQASYEKILRELQKAKVDGEEFIRLRRQIEELRPLRERAESLERLRKELTDARRNLLAEWEEAKSADFQQLQKAARKVSRALAGRVQVDVAFAANREPLLDLLKGIGGRMAESLDTVRASETLSLNEFATACRSGREALMAKFDFPTGQAERIAQAPEDLFMRVEELDLLPTTTIKLNVAPDGSPPSWQRLEQLSTGQKATAVLLLLLLESDGPLVVDQPEDDLDNRFITDGVVPKMREEKRKRQFVFATHNANIPVLGDAELIIGLNATGEGGDGKAVLPREHMGSIDHAPVRQLVGEVLEGGRAAFEMRRMKYGY